MQHTYASPFLILDEWVSVSRCSLYILFNFLARYPSSTNSAKMALFPRLWNLKMIFIGVSSLELLGAVELRHLVTNVMERTYNMIHYLQLISFWLYQHGISEYSQLLTIQEKELSMLSHCLHFGWIRDYTRTHYPRRKQRRSQTKHEWLKNLVCKPSAWLLLYRCEFTCMAQKVNGSPWHLVCMLHSVRMIPTTVHQSLWSKLWNQRKIWILVWTMTTDCYPSES